MIIKKTIKKMIATGLTTVLAASIMMGCGSSSSKSVDASDPSKLQEVKLKMYLIGDKPKDFDTVYGKVNEIMKKKINATLDVSFLPWSDMTTKYQLLFQSGENFDLIFTAAGWGYYSQVATKNGFYELTDDMLQKYAPNTYKNEPKEAWKQAKVNGKVYMVPSDREEYGTNVYGVRGDLMKKYGIDKIKSYDDLEKYMDAASKDTGVKVIANGGGQNLQWPYMLEKYGFTTINGAPSPSIGFKATDTSGNVFAFVDSPEYKEYATKMKEFAKKGYWASDAISSKATRDDDFKAGKTATMVWNTGSVANAVQQMNKSDPTWDAQVVDLSAGTKRTVQPYVNNGVAINAISKNPERALMAIDLLKYDKDINALTWYGVEGTHWQADGDKKYKTLDASANFPATNVCPWGWYNTEYARTSSDEPAIVQEILNNWKKNDTVTNPLSSFSFDDSKLKNEMAAVGNVITQYGVPIDLGMEDDVDAAIKQYRTKLTEAGFDKILEECQKQAKAYVEQYNK
jgi:putative aldouronate transport system substrate-binding protein